MKWYEQVTNASPLFGEYVEEILGNKMSRALPNHVVMVPSDQAKNWMVSFFTRFDVSGTRIVDSTQTQNQQSGWYLFFSEWQPPF